MSTPFQPVPGEPVEPTPEMFAPAPPSEQFGLPREAPVFNFLDVLLVFGAALVLVLIIPTVAVVAAHATSRYSSVPLKALATEPLVIIPAQAVAYLLLVGFVHLLLVARHNVGLSDAIPLAWPRKGSLQLISIAVVLAFLIMALEHYLPMPKELPIEQMFRTRSGAFVMVAFGVFVAPFVEELLFRGFLYPVLNRSLGAGFAVVLTSLGFTLLHGAQLALAWAPLLGLFIVAIVLTLVRARFASVTASTLVHMAYNATLCAVVFFTTSGFRNMGP
jgi:uncharacterized protein